MQLLRRDSDLIKQETRLAASGKIRHNTIAKGDAVTIYMAQKQNSRIGKY